MSLLAVHSRRAWPFGVVFHWPFSIVNSFYVSTAPLHSQHLVFHLLQRLPQDELPRTPRLRSMQGTPRDETDSFMNRIISDHGHSMLESVLGEQRTQLEDKGGQISSPDFLSVYRFLLQKQLLVLRSSWTWHDSKQRRIAVAPG